MIDEEYIELMVAMTDALARLDPEHPHCRHDWDLLLKDIKDLHKVWTRNRRYRHLTYIVKLLFWILFLAVVVLMLVC